MAEEEKRPQETSEAEVNEESEVEVEDTQRKRVEELLDEHYTPLEIEKTWGYSHSTVFDIVKKRHPPKRERGEEKGEDEGEAGEEPMLPLVLNTGTKTATIVPEALLKYYFLSDGDPGKWMLRGMMLLRAAQLMNLTDVEIMKGQADAQAQAIKPILQVMEQARGDMEAAAQRAKESNIQIAEEAAAGAAARAVMRIDEKFEELKQKKVDIATVQDPMKGLMARTMETVMNQLTGMLTGQRGQMPGMVDERGKAGAGAVPGMTDSRGG